MPEEQVHLIVRKPLADIEKEIRGKYGVLTPLADVAIEQEALVFTFEGTSVSRGSIESPKIGSIQRAVGISPSRKRRKRRLRNRMKTRGWDVVAKIENSRGQSCTIYRPLYDALVSGKLKRRDAYSAVREILISNGNSPKPSSVEYFLNNTLEYIQRQGNAGPGKAAREQAHAAESRKENT